MDQSKTLRDFMIITRSTGERGERFHPLIRQALLQAAASRPEVKLRADFDVGPREHVEVFGAPDFASAREFADAVAAVEGVKSELAALRGVW